MGYKNSRKSSRDIEEEADKRLRKQAIENVRRYTKLYNEKIKALSERTFQPTKEEISEIYKILVYLCDEYEIVDTNALYIDQEKFERKRKQVIGERKKMETLLKRYERFMEKPDIQGNKRGDKDEEPEL
jgi:hypothetical protein